MRVPAKVFMACAALALVPTRAVHAHDIWLQADEFRLEKGDTLIVRQLLGEELDTVLAGSETTQELAVLRDMTPRFSLVTAQGSVDLLAELPDIRARREVNPVLERKVDFEGPALVAMEHSILYVDFTNEEFLGYLEHEGLDRERLEKHMSATEFQDEGYRRTLKSLVHVGGVAAGAGDTDLHRRVLGQEIEILLLQDPYRLDPGAELEVQVLLRGQPLADQVVNAFNRDGKGQVSKQQARTDPEGITRFTLDRAASGWSAWFTWRPAPAPSGWTAKRPPGRATGRPTASSSTEPPPRRPSVRPRGGIRVLGHGAGLDNRPLDRAVPIL